MDSRIHEYNSLRRPEARGSFCHAPSVNLNFDQSGKVTACCYNRTFVLGTYPNQSISEIWCGPEAESLRNYLKSNDLSHGCEICLEQFKARNYIGMRSQHFDDFVEPASADGLLWPKVMEFEISNLCNLECVMCTGHFSNLIRKNREKLPPLPNQYDMKFVEQLKPFLPHLRWARFLGGEPFLNPIYFEIWNELVRVNPNVSSSITTNGTVLNNRVKEALENLKPYVVVSIDSLDEKNYEQIRKNASFGKLMKNLEYFFDYARRNIRAINVAVCPMVNNWQELPLLVNFCNGNPCQIYFNTVIWPPEMSLKSLPQQELRRIVTYLKGAEIKMPWPPAPGIEMWRRNVCESNLRAYKDLINQIEGWLVDAAPEVHA